MIIGTKVEFENLADYILRDYLGSEYESYKPFDVNAFAKDYLKLEISYCEFNPKDNIEGKRIGNQIQLDQRLNEPTRVGERNFTVAHECGHDLINWQDPNYVPDQTINYRIRSQRKELKTENDFREWQANVVASCLLLRPCLVDWTMFTFARKEKITVFGGYTIHRIDRYIIRMMAQYLGVSQECLRYRLDRLGYLDHKPIAEYDPVMDMCLSWEVNQWIRV
ncbi:MAG: ImmA/IrrE family metallo-endopeptidase [Clostridia bacterium]|jgi:Zn-dependent peptidase ImmA (M78 family)|nr:ImmA/IrrE family metallo-endopeptidase [Clostridia bacterium]